MKQKEYYKPMFKLFLDEPVPDIILEKYLNDKDGHGMLELQDFIGNNIKDSIWWCTSYGIIEAVEHLYKTAIENGNIKED